MSFLVVIDLLILPPIAALRTGWDLRWIRAYAVVISYLSYWVYAEDKEKARWGEWRVPEARLHFLDLLGGWPGGFLAQRRLRHKCSKGSFQVTFWLTVQLWQFVALDSLQNWAFSKVIAEWVDDGRRTEQRR